MSEIKFRIIQKRDCLFSIQRLYSVRSGKFWKKVYKDVWINVTMSMNAPAIINMENLAIFDSKDDAMKAISDFYKYPIIHNFKTTI